MTRNAESAVIHVDPERVISFIECGAKHGEGEPVVLLHGIGSAARSWRHQLDGLSDRFRLIAWDAPGYGGSTCLPGAAPRPEDYAAALDGFVSALRLEAFHLVGHSLGALIAAGYARRHPGRVRSLTLASIASGHAHLPEAERARLRDGRLDVLDRLGPRGMADSRGPHLLSPNATEAMRRAVIETMALIRPDGYRQAVLMLSAGDTRADLAEVDARIPVQIVYGGEDTITPPESNHRTAQARADAPVHAIGGAGHAVYIERAAEFDRIVGDFISTHSVERNGR